MCPCEPIFNLMELNKDFFVEIAEVIFNSPYCLTSEDFSAFYLPFFSSSSLEVQSYLTDPVYTVAGAALQSPTFK